MQRFHVYMFTLHLNLRENKGEFPGAIYNPGRLNICWGQCWQSGKCPQGIQPFLSDYRRQFCQRNCFTLITPRLTPFTKHRGFRHSHCTETCTRAKCSRQKGCFSRVENNVPLSTQGKQSLCNIWRLNKTYQASSIIIQVSLFYICLECLFLCIKSLT